MGPVHPEVELKYPWDVRIGDRVLHQGRLAEVLSTGREAAWFSFRVRGARGLPVTMKARSHMLVAVEKTALFSCGNTAFLDKVGLARDEQRGD